MKVPEIYSFTVFLVFTSIRLNGALDLKCSEDFCNDYKVNNGCPILPVECRAQNSTHNGMIFDSPTPCSCCETCLIHLKEDDECSIGMPGAPAPKSICGPSLYCTQHGDGTHPTCRSIFESNALTPCYTKQKEYDDLDEAGDLGSLMVRPKCDEFGDFYPIHCTPNEICYCVSKDGRRIFGESIKTPITEIMMKCECALMADRSAQLSYTADDMRFRGERSLRCAADGSYEELQCIGDLCMCVYSVTGDPNSEAVNITVDDISKLKDICKGTTDLLPCESEQEADIREITKFEKRGYHVLEHQRHNCQPDGRYKSVQLKETKKICVDKFGKQIKNFEAEQGNADYDEMTCNCARALWLFETSGMSDKSPICDSNGNYPEFICKDAEEKICWCVDENGNQISKENASSQLHCDKLKPKFVKHRNHNLNEYYR